MTGDRSAAVSKIIETQRTRKPKQRRQRQPRYHVVLWDDDDHTYDYVIRMMQQLFGFTQQQAYEIAQTVDHHGRAICFTSTFEHAELKRDQIRAFGKDELIGRCAGSMYATIQPEG